ncbi:AI-2E family transporter [Bradyrhizobium sp. SSBR45G]|uniref:AI-2E family transporter n=1 Tax=unclassified Bradyrhizobium TaxID=2631580 RepID=UPI002342AB9C|nr:MULTISPECIES: AI-2E family transporter [unclassified Bradyrhizobium]GLH75832.1 AI-2E family transporter [Bradyrhizobium sp. SSBR45G]GLH85069.1 AI-2E family transporter [Bradyrhizobium sp. SSBR45R]
MTAPADPRLQARSDLAWAIAVGGIGVILFMALLAFSWYYAAAIFLLFSGMLLGVALNAMTSLLGRVLPWPHPARLAIVCVALAAVLVGIVFLGGTTIADQAKVLSDTIKSQLGNIKGFLDRNGIDTSFFDFNAASTATAPPDGGSTTPTQPSHSLPGGLPSPSALASSGGAIVSQTFKLLLGTVSAVGNFFIVLFLGLAFAAQPAVYRSGLLFLAPAKYRDQATVIVDRISYTLERWLIAQITTMFAVFAVTWIGLAIIGVQSSFILGIQAGLLAFIPTVGAIIAGVIVVLASLASGWVAAVSAFVLFLGVHAMESYVLTPLIQRQALDIPPATLFAVQILLGIVFGVWGLTLALPLMAIAKVMIDYFKSDRSTEDAAAAI